MGTIKTIVHPTDFSESSNNAFIWACSLARENRAKLIILHVMLPSGAPLLDVSTPESSQPTNSGRDLENSFPWPVPSDRGIVVEHCIEEGDAADVILRFTQSVQGDVIVIGTHGRTGLRRLLTGSVAEEVLRKATCPVLVVKDPPHVISATSEIEIPATPGEVVDVSTITVKQETAGEHTLIHGHELDVARLTIPAGHTIEKKQSTCEVVMHCISGRVELSMHGKTQQLTTGRVVSIPKNQAYRMEGIKTATFLVVSQSSE